MRRMKSETSDPAEQAIEEARLQIRESLDNAKRLVERTKFLLTGDAEADQA